MKTLQELTLFDKFLFDEVMEIPEAYEAILRIILGDETLKLLTPTESEKELRTMPWLRQIRLDVYAMDQEKRIYNTESQSVRKSDLAKRSRFYQALIDGTLLEPGDVSFNRMNDVCIIIITPFDLFGEGKYCYTFRQRCDEDPALELKDGAVRIFLNSHGTNREEVSPELVELLEYMELPDANRAEQSKSDNLKNLHKHVRQLKASEEVGVKYMQKWEEKIYDRQEGIEEGIASAEIATIRRQLTVRGKTIA